MSHSNFFPEFETKMRAARVSDAAIRAFKHNYESLVAPLIEAVKAQQEELRRLTPLVEEVGAHQEEIKRLELRLDAQKREIDDLKSRSPHTQPASFHPDSQPSP